MNSLRILVTMLAVLVAIRCTAQDLLPSWNDGPAKKAILKFVAAVTDEKGKDYVEPTDRIAALGHVSRLFSTTASTGAEKTTQASLTNFRQEPPQ